MLYIIFINGSILCVFHTCEAQKATIFTHRSVNFELEHIRIRQYNNLCVIYAVVKLVISKQNTNEYAFFSRLNRKTWPMFAFSSNADRNLVNERNSWHTVLT